MLSRNPIIKSILVDCYSLCEHLKSGIADILNLPISFINLYQNSEVNKYRENAMKYDIEYKEALIKRIDNMTKIIAMK